MTLLSRLLVLVFVALLPAIAIQAYNEFDLRRSRQIEVQNHAVNLADLAAAEQRQIVQGIRQVLIVLSQLPSIKARDGQECNATLGAVKQRFPVFLTLVVTDLKGRPFAIPTIVRSQSIVSARAYFATALKTGDFTVGEFSFGLQSGRRAIQFALPFYGTDGQIGGVIIGTLNLDWLADYIAKKKRAPQREPRSPSWTATAPSLPAILITLSSSDEGPRIRISHLTIRALPISSMLMGCGGLSVTRLWEMLPGGLLISFGLDKAQVFAGIQRRTQHGIFLICLSTALALALISLGARRFIHHPLGQLVDAANQWRIGQFSRRVDIQGKSEIARSRRGLQHDGRCVGASRSKELSEAKERAEEAAARITMIFESTTDSVVIVDLNWRISYLNGPAWTLIENRNLIGMTLFEVVPDVACSEVMSELREAISDRRSAVAEVFCSGRNVWYAINAFLLRRDSNFPSAT